MKINGCLHIYSIFRYVIFCVLLIPAFNGVAQESCVYDNLSFKSNILRKEKKYSIYLPPGYHTSHRHYPVVYLLHGGGTTPLKHMDWIQQGDMQRIVDEAICKGEIAPMIIVMPDAEQTYYMNNVDGNYQIEDFFIKELIPHIEENYRCRIGKTNRAIMGLSMGGFGSLLYAMHHPELFSACAALSPGIRTNEQILEMPHKEYFRRYRNAMGEIGEDDIRITDYWNQNSILYLLKHLPLNQLKSVRYYIDIGDDDYLYKGSSLLHISMKDLGVEHEYRVRDGAHTWSYWREGLTDALGFLSMSFR